MNFYLFLLTIVGLVAIIGEAKVHLSNVENFQHDDPIPDFELIGTDSNFVKFEGIPQDIVKNLTTLYLNFVEFDPNILVQSISECENLKILHMNSVEWIGKFNTRAILPNLEEFVLFRSRGLHGVDKKRMKSILFFDKTDKPWKIEEIAQQQVTIHTNSLIINHYTRTIQSSLDFTKSILQSILKTENIYKLNQLILDQTDVPIDVFPTTLETLILRNVVIQGQSSLDEIFKKTPILKELEITGTIPNLLDLSNLPLSTLESMTLNNVQISQPQPIKFQRLTNLTLIVSHVHPSIIPESLKFLELDDAFIDGGNFDEILNKIQILEKLVLKRSTPSIINISRLPIQTLIELHIDNMNLEIVDIDIDNIKNNVVFKNLKEFICNDCNFDVNIIENFEIIFQNVEFFELWFRNMRISNHQILFKILEQTKAIRIEMIDFNRSWNSNTNSIINNTDESNNKNKIFFETVEKFLSETGVPMKETVFLLEKNKLNGIWKYSHPSDIENGETHP